MDVLFERCCGLDVHKKLVVACVIITPPDGEPERTVHSFGTMTEDLLKLADWLEACGVSHVAMESTGGPCWLGWSTVRRIRRRWHTWRAGVGSGSSCSLKAR